MKLFSLFAVCVFLCACTAPSGQNALPAGSDRDAHGCIASAGYTYSSVQARCVRLWEEGVRLDPVSARPAEAVFSAFVLLSKDGARAELFLPQAAAVVMTRAFTADGPYWAAQDLRLDRAPRGWRLYQKGVLVFSAPNPAETAN